MKKIIILSIFLMFISCTTISFAADLEVGSGEYSTIQSAIDAANPGDTITVNIGSYSENIVIDKTLTITGVNKDTTIISGSTDGHIITITADYVNLSGFSIQDAQGTEYDAIMIDKADNCKITGNIIQNSDDGIYLLDAHSNTISDNAITNNDNNGIYIYFADNNIVNNNEITYNQNGVNIGVNSDNNEIYENNIMGQTGLPKGTGLNIGTSTSGNVVYKNYFNDFSKNANDLSTSNTWYKSSSQDGNYWDDYTGSDSGNGKGDTPYDIPGAGGNQDLYPLGYFVETNDPPTVEILTVSPNPALKGNTVTLEARVTDDGSISYYEWRVDGVIVSNSEDTSISTSGYSIGTHSITFKVQDDQGDWSNTDSASLSIYEESNEAPIVTSMTILPDSGEYGTAIYFAGEGADYDSGDSIAGYSWTSSIDGFLKGVNTFSKSDLSIGTHTIKFKVRDTYGVWSSESTSTVTITAPVNSENTNPTSVPGGPYSGDVNTSISFDGSGSYDSDEEDSISSYEWDFGDGTTGSGSIIEHIYSSDGSFTVELTVYDNNGGWSKSSTTVTVNAVENGDTPDNDTDKSDDDKIKIPGFELILFMFAVVCLIIIKKKKNSR